VPSVRFDEKPVAVLTVAAHSDPGRVGEYALVDEMRSGRLSRNEPDFQPVRGGRRAPLADRYLSRRALRLIRKTDDELELWRDDNVDSVSVDGQPLEQVHRFSATELVKGVVFGLSDRIVLVLHQQRRPRSEPLAELGMVGQSDALELIRAEILQVASLPVPVLLRGASGTGKELVAQAIHQASGDPQRPFVPVSMAALAPSMAASELFGHIKGAFTGAVRDHLGFFRKATGGTLFLDEIGDTPLDVQATLLRVLETGDVQPVGSTKSHRVDVRLIAATDAALEQAIDRGDFRLPLFHRLSGYQIHLPPLRERRDDIGRLLNHFLRQELAATGDEHLLSAPSDTQKPWLSASVVERLLRYDWPGNVRQLRNVARRLIVASRDCRISLLDTALEQMLEGEPQSPEGPETPAIDPEVASATKASGRVGAAPAELSDKQLRAAMRQTGWRLSDAAKALGIARSTMYRLVERCPSIRMAKQLQPEEISSAAEQCDGDVQKMSERLEVSVQGLRLRMKALGVRR